MRPAHTNLTAYDDCERKEYYDTPEKLASYRQLLLDKTVKQKDFIKKLFPGKFTMLEACSGNSRLLYALSDSLEYGIGVEISKSRYEFAEAWKKELGITNIVNFNKDIMQFLHGIDGFDLVAIMSNAFMYFEPIDKTYPLKLLGKFHWWLRDKGKLIMELRDYGHLLVYAAQRGNEAVVEITFPLADPFEGTKTHYRWHPETKYLELEEVFTKRGGEQYNRNEILRVYSLGEIKDLFGKSGFTRATVYKNNINPEPSEDKIIIVAEK